MGHLVLAGELDPPSHRLAEAVMDGAVVAPQGGAVWIDGTLYGADEHREFRFDAWRTLSNVAVDYAWFAADPWQVAQSNRVLEFFVAQGINTYANQFTLDGSPLSADHSTGLVSMAAVAALSADSETGKPFVQQIWNAQIPSGKWRYYDGMLYMLGLLHVSGNFRIHIH